MIEIRATSAAFGAVQDLVGELNAALERELRAANQRIGLHLNGQAKKLLQEEVYNVPIPLLASADRTFDMARVPEQLRPFVKEAKFKKALGAKNKVREQTTKGQYGQWERTRFLRDQEMFTLTTDSRGAGGVVLTNNANYAAARAALGGPNPPNRAGRKAGEQRPQAGKPDAQKSKTKAVGNWQFRVVKKNREWIAEQYKAAIGRTLGRTP